MRGHRFFDAYVGDGTIERIMLAYLPEQPIASPRPRYGDFDEAYRARLRPYIERLRAAEGIVKCPPAVRMMNVSLMKPSPSELIAAMSPSSAKCEAIFWSSACNSAFIGLVSVSVLGLCTLKDIENCVELQPEFVKKACFFVCKKAGFRSS